MNTPSTTASKWQSEAQFAHSYRLVTPDGEIVAEVHRSYGGVCVFGMRQFTDPDSAKAAAERSLQP